nr:hypothetical protein BSM_16010 [uncultured archaeon]
MIADYQDLKYKKVGERYTLYTIKKPRDFTRLKTLKN